MSQWWEGESTVPGEPTAPGGSSVSGEWTVSGAPSPRRPSRWLLVVGGLWLVAAVAALVAVVVLRSGSSGDGVDALPPKGTVRLEPVTYASSAPFTPSVVSASLHELPKLAGRVVSGERPAVSGGSVQGDAALLYATASQSPCDRAKLLAKLRSDSRLAAAWSSAAGVDPSGIDALVGSLTPVMLRVDTAVTNHVYQSGSARAYQSVLQAGTPVMVDPTGLPRVQCSCGNPLLAPAAARSTRTDGERWKLFAHDQVVSVTPAPAPVPVFDTVDVETAKPAKTGSGSNSVLDGTLVAATDGLFVAPAAGGDLVKVLDQSVDSVFDDGRGGLVYTLADQGNQYRNDRPSAPEKTVIWHLAAGAAEATQLITPPPGGWEQLLAVGRLGDRTYVVYQELHLGTSGFGNGADQSAQGSVGTFDLETRSAMPLGGVGQFEDGGVESVSFGGNRLLILSSADSYWFWEVLGPGPSELPGACRSTEMYGTGTPQSKLPCVAPGVLDERGTIVGVDGSDDNGSSERHIITSDPVSGTKATGSGLSGLRLGFDTWMQPFQAIDGRLLMRGGDGGERPLWQILDVSTGADVTPPIGSHQVNTMWMLTAPIVRPGHQESSTTTVPTTTAPASRAPTFDELEASFPSSICDSDSGSIRFDSSGNWNNSKSDTGPGYISISLGPANYQEADVDGDGAAEALVVPTCSEGGNSYWTPVAAVRSGPDGRVVVVGNPITGFGKGGRAVEEMSMDGGTLVITGKQWVDGDPFGAPSKPYVLRYKLVDGTWVQQP